MLAASLALAALAGLGLAAPPVQASPLDGPRDAGIVGERYDGYAQIRDETRADAALHTLVDDINTQRRAYYEQQARSEGVSADAISLIYAETIFEKAPAGWWFLLRNRGWVQK
ncbi:MAG: YdbL family protein [Alphaproteobacteria bacterium]|nr:YdbL family protein [Alphaproteobacteria bacterium]